MRAGRCRRPVADGPAGYLVRRVSAVGWPTREAFINDPMVALDEGPAWAAGDLVDVYPVRRTRRCGRCWACRWPRVARVVELVRAAAAVVRRRNVTIAVVALMTLPGLVLAGAAFGAGRWF